VGKVRLNPDVSSVFIIAHMSAVVEPGTTCGGRVQLGKAKRKANNMYKN
jgi:hypothetical protein